MHHAADHRQRGKDDGQRATDNVQQTADDMQEDAITCEMQQGNTRHCLISCAASRGQRTSSSMREAWYSTTSTQHGTDATRKMQHTTGAAACSKQTRNRHHAAGIETYEMRRTESGRSLSSRLLRPSGRITRKDPARAAKVSGCLEKLARGDASDVAARRLHNIVGMRASLAN